MKFLIDLDVGERPTRCVKPRDRMYGVLPECPCAVDLDGYYVCGITQDDVFGYDSGVPESCPLKEGIEDLTTDMFIRLVDSLPRTNTADFLPDLLRLGIAPTKEEVDEYVWDDAFDETYDAIIKDWKEQQ